MLKPKLAQRLEATSLKIFKSIISASCLKSRSSKYALKTWELIMLLFLKLTSYAMLSAITKTCL